MAKRRKLNAPSPEDLNRLEEEFRRETSPRGPMAPIAQVAADAAQHAPVMDAASRAEQARIKADADALQEARDKGLVIAEIPLDQIEETHMIRDRTTLMAHELEELRLSIASSGLRLPIEVQPLPDTDTNKGKYALISGYRRLLAVRDLNALHSGKKYTTIKALIRPQTDLPNAFVQMVEENEIRANLSHYERGRIAVLAAQNGAFTNLQDAVDKLFSAASKAKRSKVRSFAQIFEDLGDLLSFPEDLTEKQGLRLSAALRAGAERQLREALAESAPATAADEWDTLQAALEMLEDRPRPKSRGGRPAKRKAPSSPDVIEVAGGVTLRHYCDAQGYTIRLAGPGVDSETLDAILIELQRLLERK